MFMCCCRCCPCSERSSTSTGTRYIKSSNYPSSETGTAEQSKMSYKLQSIPWLDSYLEECKQEFESKYKQPSSSQDSIRNYTLIKTLGMGSFGRVMLASHNDRKEEVYAIKILIKHNVVKTKQIEHTINEKQLLDACNCPFIVNMAAAFKDSTNLYMVMEFVNGGEMFLFLRRKGRFPEAWSQFYAAQVVLMFAYLHNVNIIYRDLKPENILMSFDGYLKLGDFGFAKRVQGITWTLCGTPQYLAPEVILNKGYNKAVDYWAIGILIYEMCAGYPPFDHEVPIKMYEKIVSGHYTVPKHFKKDLIDLLTHLIQLDVTRRYGNLKNGAVDIILHPWFKEIDFKRILSKDYKAPWKPNVKSALDTSNFDTFKEETIAVSKTDKYTDEFANF